LLLTVHPLQGPQPILIVFASWLVRTTGTTAALAAQPGEFGGV